MKLSPRYFHKLVKAQREKSQRDDRMLELMGGQIVAMIANTGFKGWEEQRKPEEFMPSEWRKQKKVSKFKMTKLQKLQEVAEWRKVFDIVSAANARGEQI